MATLYILCGYPFAGKSTLADTLIKKYGFIRVAIDSINDELGIGRDYAVEIAPAEWQRTYDIYHDRIRDNLQASKSVIADTVAHTKVSRDALRNIANECNAKTVILYVNTPLEVAKKRWLDNRINKKRSDVRDSDFNTVANNFESPDTSENVITVPNNMSIKEVYKLIEA